MPDICQSSHKEYKIYVHMQLYNMFSYLSVKPFDSTLQCLWQVLKCLKMLKILMQYNSYASCYSLIYNDVLTG